MRGTVLRIAACSFVAATLLAAISLPRASIQASAPGQRPEVLRSVDAVPPDIVGLFREPIDFEQASSGQYFVFDRRGHAVYGIDAAKTGAWRIVQIGQEEGRIIEPTAFSLHPNGTFAVADAPDRRERVQFFTSGGARFGGFLLPGRAAARVVIGTLVLNGTGSLQYTGRSVLVSRPEDGSLFTEYSLSGDVIRYFGALRVTGQEADRQVHLGLNAGLPLVNPKGGYYFVFQAGVPMFRKYDDAGVLRLERHIEGVELDPVISALPTKWPRRKTEGGEELPIIPPTVLAAAVDRTGNLWVSLGVGCTYVYDLKGERIRVVQFRAAGLMAPTSLFFSSTGRLLVTPGCYEFRSPYSSGGAEGAGAVRVMPTPIRMAAAPATFGAVISSFSQIAAINIAKAGSMFE
jgi:hypothetical protein